MLVLRELIEVEKTLETGDEVRWCQPFEIEIEHLEHLPLELSQVCHFSVPAIPTVEDACHELDCGRAYVNGTILDH